jgi:hypothetical protein
VPYHPELTEELVRSGAVDFIEVKLDSLSEDGQLDLNHMDQLRRWCGGHPVVLRGERPSEDAHANQGYLDLLDSFQREWQFAWHSEPSGPSENATDLQAFDSERRFGAPFLIDASREISMGSGAWRSLNLSLLHAEACAVGFDAFNAIENMALNAVAEIRVDSEPAVWDLFEYVRPLCPNIGGVIVDAPYLGAVRLHSQLGRARRAGAGDPRRG